MKIYNSTNAQTIVSNAIVIGGSARSGTTLVGNIVGSLENIEYFFEPPTLTYILNNIDEMKLESTKELVIAYLYNEYFIDSLAGRNLNINRNDDSCIYNSKEEEEITKRLKSSYRRSDLESIALSSRLAFKIPDIAFNFDELVAMFPQQIRILMNRNPNDIISSSLKKGWFTDQHLSSNTQELQYSKGIINGLHIPFWVENDKYEFWINATQANRIGYYLLRLNEYIIKQKDESFIINYEFLMEKPKKIIGTLSSILNSEMTKKTEEIISNISYKTKHSKILDTIDLNLKEKLYETHQLIKDNSIE